ncbi:hypothetical protein C6P40_002705 [Pichia californica]|uniref:Uncharacterized protein n=1 Tax=Pichia californica TaxID=460514 RepID=A0A9P6WQ92_9ASCO|nr:hypothetical protein C6P42_001654 [[Candida] californica]KAG0691314.1 hypothetical protein C6P40_002705 [[Candida] californica]
MPAINLSVNECNDSSFQLNSHTSKSSNFNSDLRKLVNGINNELKKRDLWYNDDSDPARYAFFAFFIAGIIIFLIMICLANARRMKEGRTPLISSYLAPPSYNQSQVAYEGQTTTNLPTYTPNANVNQDVGFYDKNGNFIPTKVESQDGIIQDDDNNNNNNTYSNENRNGSIELTDTSDNGINTLNNQSNPFSHDTTTSNLPSQAHTDSNINDAQLSDMVYKRPDAPPPTKTYNLPYTAVGSSNNNIDDEELPPYETPETPVKSHYKS